MSDRLFFSFYRWVFFLPLLPYLSFVAPVIPERIGPFNISGWSWVLMFAVTLYYLVQQRNNRFPVSFWIPWIVYVLLYLVADFSFPGLQLTIQYVLPFMVGIVASGFTYSKEKMHWLFKGLFFTSGVIAAVFAYGHFFRGGWTPMTAYTPMLLSVTAAVTIGIFYLTKKLQFLLLYFLLFLIPFIDVTRMGIAVFLVIFIFHFANRKILSKVAFSVIGAAAVLFVFNSKSFQEKMFFEGRGSLSDLSLNYYDETNKTMNTSGRAGFLQYYEKGLRNAPLLGNGPRSDMYALKSVWGGAGVSEAHNDYVAVRYNYGYIGLALLLFGFLLTFVITGLRFFKEKNPYKVLIQSSLMILTLTFLLYMYSDNILKSTTFFTDLYFVLIGITFAEFKD
ncbi:MAG: hypothetical protein HGA70_00290 [Chlorobiaceae bacterium]|nr:hypothetical protein [Chlorobiaceae bacterium]